AAVLFERGLELTQSVHRCVRANRLIIIQNDRIALSLRYLDRNYLVCETAGFLCLSGFAVRIESKLILLFAADLVFLRHYLTGVAHVPIFEWAPESVVDHQVDN